MEPPTPSKLALSPPMPIFPVSPERTAGTKPPYGAPAAGATPQSPPIPELRASPLRKHRRGDSSVSSLASMFENLGVKDPKDVHAGYIQGLEKQKAKYANEMQDMQRKYENQIARLEIRNEELRGEVKEVRSVSSETMPRDLWDKQREEHRTAIAKWEERMRWSEEHRKTAEMKAYEFNQMARDLKGEVAQLKKENIRMHKEALRRSDMIPQLQTKIDGLQRNIRLLESDIKFHSGEAEKYKNMAYGLQVDVESVSARLGEEVQTLKDKLRLIEGERDALKTSLKEEEVMRIAAEGQIPLPAVTTEEQDEFASPRSPRKQPEAGRDDNKENVAPKKTAVELRLLQQDLAAEKRLRERAQEQVEFMKMECQFRICSCRIADLKGSRFVHDDTFTEEMERIKASVPELTPPPSAHENDVPEEEHMDTDLTASTRSQVVVKAEPMDEDMHELPLAPGPKRSSAQIVEQVVELAAAPVQETELAFSPTTGTFRSVPSPSKALAAAPVVTPRPSLQEPAEIIEQDPDLSPWEPDANSTMIPLQRDSLPHVRLETQIERGLKSRPQSIHIHEDAAAAGYDEEEVQTPLHGPTGPATPAQWMMRTITTTTTIPLHFSPATPAGKGADYPLTPSTVAHAPANAQTNALGEVSLNALPFDREAALAAIRQRRGRARSLAAGQATPGKQMMDGVKERRDISAPVYRVRR